MFVLSEITEFRLLPVIYFFDQRELAYNKFIVSSVFISTHLLSFYQNYKIVLNKR